MNARKRSTGAFKAGFKAGLLDSVFEYLIEVSRYMASEREWIALGTTEESNKKKVQEALAKLTKAVQFMDAVRRKHGGDGLHRAYINVLGAQKFIRESWRQANNKARFLNAWRYAEKNLNAARREILNTKKGQ